MAKRGKGRPKKESPYLPANIDDCAPEPPAGVQDDEIALACWRRIVPQLEEMNVLARIDSDSLSCYCLTYARWQRAMDYLREHGGVINRYDSDGNLTMARTHPYATVARDLLTLLARYQREFGMTPHGRCQIRVDKAGYGEAKRGLNEFMAEGYTLREASDG